jgi:penicillin-binding protein 1C
MSFTLFKRRIILTTMGVVLAAAVGLAWLVFGNLPSPAALSGQLNTPSIRIVDRNGQALYEILAENGGRHAVLPLEAIPLTLQQATIATEDSRFYSNPGIDLVGVLRSMWINLRGGETLAGGSTITQQVARNLLLNETERSQRSLRRKLREALLAWQLTRRYSKNEILGMYLNQMYYGGLAYGVEAAAQTYFGKPASELDLAESAMVAGLPQAPALYNPFSDLEAARQRQSVVLGLMESQGYITAEQRSTAAREPLVLSGEPYPIEAPHFVLMVRALLDEILTPEQIYDSGGLVVQTTLDLNWQHKAENAVARQIENLKRSQDGLGHNVNNAGLVALDPATGEILAMVGNTDYFDADNHGAINMALAPRQPGSALKPLVYAKAFDPARPNPWTAATQILDVRTAFVTHDGRAYQPENYDLQEHGPVLARQALASSLNIPAVKTLDHIGLADLFSLAQKLGISSLNDPENYDLSLALGGGEVRLLDLTAAYGAFANGGLRVQPVAIQSVRTLEDESIYSAPQPQQPRVLDERVAWLISDILSDNQARTLGFGPNSALRLDRPAAVKTGTTTNFHDNWTVGYTPELVVGVWTGNASYEPMREVDGLSGAAPIWHQFIRSVLTGSPETPFQRPPGMTRLEICNLSGLLPGQACPYHRLEWFIDGTQPTQTDTIYKRVQIDPASGLLIDPPNSNGAGRWLTVLDLPLEARSWARIEGLTLLSDLQARNGLNSAQGGSPGANQAALQIVSPPANSLYRLSSTYNQEAQRIQVAAVSAPGLREVSLWLDGRQLAGFSQAPFEIWLPLEVGDHQVWAQALGQNGEVVESPRIQFQVLAPDENPN